MTSQGSPMWARCELCGCLVESSTLRSRRYTCADSRGEPRTCVQVVCRDAAACAARSSRLDHWELVQAEIPYQRQPAPEAPLFRCLQCDVAAAAAEVAVALIWDRSDGTWFSEIICTDRDDCERRLHEDTPLRPDPPQ